MKKQKDYFRKDFNQKNDTPFLEPDLMLMTDDQELVIK